MIVDANSCDSQLDNVGGPRVGSGSCYFLKPAVVVADDGNLAPFGVAYQAGSLSWIRGDLHSNFRPVRHLLRGRSWSDAYRTILMGVFLRRVASNDGLVLGIIRCRRVNTGLRFS